MLKIEIEHAEDMESPLGYGEFHITYKLSSRHLLGDTPLATWGEMQKIYNSSLNIALPVYTYIHSGIAMQTHSFYGQLPQGHAEFDSGQSGIIFISKADVRAMYGVSRITAAVRQRVEAEMREIVPQYASWLNGDCWHLSVYDSEGVLLDTYDGIGDYEAMVESIEEEYRATAKVVDLRQVYR